MKKCLLFLITLVISFTTVVSAFAQGTVKGKIVDGTTKDPLPGATVILKGTSQAVPAGADGTFTMQVNDANATAILINFVGFTQKEVSIAGLNGTKNLGTISLQPSESSLGEILVTANSYAIERETPVAISTITSEVIVEKVGNQEFPELLKSTPGVYATKAGGGFGDSRINLRGFQSQNVAVLINGVPVNDMENGRVYWSNWAGLTDVTKSMQVQRGLGASKVAVPSVGGTINIITKTTDAVQGGNITYGIGNDGYNKMGLTYSTGLLENGWAFSLAGSKTEGNGWADGLEFEAYNYFFNVSKLINDKHTISLTGFGAPQWHGQRQNRQSIETFREKGLKFNSDWGYLRGEKISVEDNFYHKPQFSLNHYWTIDETSFLSTAAYVSIGTGGGGANVGLRDYRVGGAGTDTQYDLDAAYQANLDSQDGRAVAFLNASRNDHKWYGVLSTYQKSLSENFDLLGGIDLRYYKGTHFKEITNLLGADYVLDKSDENNKAKQLGVGDKFSYYDQGTVLWEGGFIQGEYKTGPLAAFVSASASNTSYKRIDYFNYVNTDPARETDYQNFLGFQIKGGANYNLSEMHNVFANLGYFERAPGFDAVFQNFQNDINPDPKNEKILSYELGYGFRTTQISANVNLYRTTWKDRTFTKSLQGADDEQYFANLLGIDALHQGVELDFNYKPMTKLSIKGMVSVGDWEWLNDLEAVKIFDDEQNQIDEIDAMYMKGIKVGDAAQTTAAIGLDYNIIDDLKIGVDYNYYTNFFADFDPTLLNKPGLSVWEVPSYSLLDLNAVFKFKVAGLNASLIGNVNNVLGTEYISDAQASFDTETGASSAANSRVFFGTGRTWTTTLKINF
ncbi:TonB-dependent receptor [Pontibacter populi]|uniref:TonB-dependent receptor n=1 Tax=Pontibacter populi TaxID=890055 RepID=A0ABV1RQ09_9BACT